MPSKALIIAGEVSGDTFAASIASELKKQTNNLDIFAIGGEQVKSAGAVLLEDMSELTVVGLTEVVKHLPHVFKVLSKVKNFLKKEKPDFVILIDYPDFNFKVAKLAYNEQIPVFYFVSPQIWAWRRGRVNFIKKYIKKLFVIFPFEVNFYKKYNVNVQFVGNPLAEKIKNFKQENKPSQNRAFTVALLPGSRTGEINKLLEIILEAAIIIKRKYPYTEFSLPIASTLDIEILSAKIKQKTPFVKIYEGNSYNVINSANLVISASGTATLESALFGKPVIIVYKVNPLSYIIGKNLIKVPYIGMPNLLLGKCYNPELIQHAATPENIYIEVTKFLKNRLKYNITSSKNGSLLEKLYMENTFKLTVDSILKSVNNG